MNGFLTFLAMFPCIVYRGLVLKVLWGWFMVPTFVQYDLPALTIPSALGIGILISMLTYHGVAGNKINSVVMSLSVSTSCLFCGWIYQFFM